MERFFPDSVVIIMFFMISIGCIMITGCIDSVGQENTNITTEVPPTKEFFQDQQIEPTTPVTPESTIHYQKGLSLFQQGKYQEALGEFNQSIEHNSKNYDAFYYRGRSYYQLGYNLSYEIRGRDEFKKAIEDYTLVIQNNPGADVYSRIGWSNIGIGRTYTYRLAENKISDIYYGYAIDNFSHALSLDQNFSDALNGRAYASLVKGSGQGYKQAGYIPYDQSLIDTGRKDIAKAIKLNDSDPWSNYVQALYYHHDNNLVTARFFLDKAIKSDPDEAYFYFQRGIVRRYSDDHAGALLDYSQAIEIQPRYANGYNWRGALRDWMKGPPEEILSDYNKAIEINPDIPIYYSNYAWGLVIAKAGYRDTFVEAVSLMDKAIELDPLNPVYHLYKGYLLTWLNRRYEAVEEFRIYRELSNTNEDIQHADMLMVQYNREDVLVDYGYFIK